MYVILERYNAKSRYELTRRLYPTSEAVAELLAKDEYLRKNYDQKNVKVFKLAPVELEEAEVTVKRLVIKQEKSK